MTGLKDSSSDWNPLPDAIPCEAEKNSFESIVIGRAVTIGDLREIMKPFSDECKLMVRNGPLPTLPLV